MKSDMNILYSHMPKSESLNHSFKPIKKKKSLYLYIYIWLSASINILYEWTSTNLHVILFFSLIQNHGRIVISISKKKKKNVILNLSRIMRLNITWINCIY